MPRKLLQTHPAVKISRIHRERAGGNMIRFAERWPVLFWTGGRGAGDRGEPGKRTPSPVHVWFVDPPAQKILPKHRFLLMDAGRKGREGDAHSNGSFQMPTPTDRPLRTHPISHCWMDPPISEPIQQRASPTTTAAWARGARAPDRARAEPRARPSSRSANDRSRGGRATR